MPNPPLILASASPRRIDLLAQIGLTADAVIPADIDETPQKQEFPNIYALRIAREKAKTIVSRQPGSVILAADTVVACGRRILPKAEDEATARQCLQLLSGRRHRIYTAVACIDQSGTLRHKTVLSRVTLKRLHDDELAAYLATGEWEGKAGGYGIQGTAEAFIRFVSGSYSNIVGLPLFETRNLLANAGIRTLS